MPKYEKILLEFAFCICVILTTLPIIVATPSNLIQPDDVEYLGAFRLPEGWEYGGTGLSYNPQGDPHGANDGTPGSLFGIGHDHLQLVSEISIPAPIITNNIDELPIATTIQPFADVTGGLRSRVGVDKVGDVLWYNNKLYWTIYEYYNVEGIDFLSHGVSSTNLQNPQAKGVWHVGPHDNPPFSSMKTADYLFLVDSQWAHENNLTLNIISGRTREAGAAGSTKGPAFFAFQAPEQNLPYGSEIDSIPLVWYGDNEFPNYRACDFWSGGAFVRSHNTSAIIIAGKKGLGDVYYGDARPTDCTIYKGYHCTPYEPEILFYDPADLVKSVNGIKHPGEVLPYATFRPQQYFFEDCEWNLGGVAYDSERNYLYVTQVNVKSSINTYEPIVHVFALPKKIEQNNTVPEQNDSGQQPNPIRNESTSNENQTNITTSNISVDEQTSSISENTNNDSTPIGSSSPTYHRSSSKDRSYQQSSANALPDSNSVSQNQDTTNSNHSVDNPYLLSASLEENSTQTNTPMTNEKKLKIPSQLSNFALILSSALWFLLIVLIVLIIRLSTTKK